MYAVIKTGGKQYRVCVGQTLKIEKLLAEPGASVDFSDVMLVGNGDDIAVGSPILENAKVSAKVLDHNRADKIDIIKFKRRKHHMKRMGHRQHYTKVEITDIQGA